MAAFPSRQPFPNALCKGPFKEREGLSGLWSASPSFCSTPTLTGREEDKKRPSVLLVSNLLLLKTALSRLDVGPAYYEDPVSSNPTYTLYGGIKGPLLDVHYEAYLLFIKLKRERFSWCAVAHSSFSFTSRGSRGSYAAAFPYHRFLLVLRPEARASS